MINIFVGDNGDEDEEEEENEEGKHINTKGYSDEPPLKRTKPHSWWKL